jgi:hypothetical protein
MLTDDAFCPHCGQYSFHYSCIGQSAEVKQMLIALAQALRDCFKTTHGIVGHKPLEDFLNKYLELIDEDEMALD